MTAAEPALADVLPSALAAIGVPGWADQLGLRERVGDVRRIGVLLVDGLGYHLLPRTRSVAPVLADVLDGSLGTLAELSSGFPSTTPTSLVSLGTGVASGEHGVLGFTLNIPGTDTVVNHIEWQDDPDPQWWQPAPTVFTRAAAAGVPVAVVSRPEYEGSGLTVSAYRGAAYVGASGVDELADRMLATLRADGGLVCGYHPSVDSAAHVHGIDSPQWLRAVGRVNRLLAHLIDGLPDDAALLVTADHGGFDVPQDERTDLDADPRLQDGVRVVAGEPRVRYLHTRPGAADDVIATWRSLLGPVADVVSRDDAIAAGWFGPVPDAHRARIGDVVVVCRDRHVVLATKREKATVSALVAYHGGMSREELAIPLIVLR
jgi:hypothetical protein